MHRKRTRFAARVHRVASALERRGVVATYELHDRLLANPASRRRYAQAPPVLDEVQRGVVDELRENGYALRPLAELLPDPGVWSELEADAAAFVSATEDGLAREPAGEEVDPAPRRRPGKEFGDRKYRHGVRRGLHSPRAAQGA